MNLAPRDSASEVSANAPVPRTLLLAATLPRTDGVGGILLAELCSLFPPDSLCVAHVREGHESERAPELAREVPFLAQRVDYRRRAASRLGRAARTVSALVQEGRNRRHFATARRACVAWARSQGIAQVWATLDSPVSIALAVPVAAALGVPMRAMVWDDVHHHIAYFGLDRVKARSLMQAFRAALVSATRCAVIGESMKAEYERAYGVSGVIVRHGAEAVPATRRAPASHWTIGFAGSVTARSAFEMLLATLDRCDWTLAGKPVVLRVMGSRFDLRSDRPRRIECCGWRSVAETIELLSQCDAAYLPQPFEPEWSAFARLSFPTKLTTYLAAGVPLVLHAPTGASLPAFLDVHPIAAWCRSLSGDELEALLVRALVDDEFRNTSVAAGRVALATELSPARFRARFADFLGVPADSLAAVRSR